MHRPAPGRWLLLAMSLLVLPATPARAVEPAVRGFIYLEPFEIRAELVMPLAATDAGARFSGELDPVVQAEALEALRPTVTAACVLRADGAPVDLELMDLTFIIIDPEQGPRADERDAIPADEALVAAVLASPRDGYPTTLELEWRLYPDVIDPVVPVELEVTNDEATLPETLTFRPEDGVRTWTVPDPGLAPALSVVAPPRVRTRLGPAVVLAGIALIAVVALIRGLAGPASARSGRLVTAGVAVALGIGLWPGVAGTTRATQVSEPEAKAIVEALLRNVYHAFAFRDESTTFDTLALSVDGPLLDELYLDIRRALEVESAGGPRVKVLRVSLVDCAIQGSTTGGPWRADVIWICAGNVSHWGHVHRRRNQYRGELVIEPRDGTWKVTGVTILEEERT